MDSIPPSYEQLQSEIEDLRFRLDEAEETLRAIRSGEVDALVVSTTAGDQVFTLEGADYYYRVLVEAMSEGAVTLTPDGMVLYSNSRFADLVERPLQKVIGATFPEFVSAKEREAFRTLLQQGMENIYRGEFTLLKADGGGIPALLSAYPLAFETQAVCVIVSDQSERKRVTEALRESEARFRLLADNSSDLIARLSPEGVYFYASPYCQKLLGYKPSELVGRSLFELIHPEDLAYSKSALLGADDKSELPPLINRMRTKSGSYTWVETTGRVLVNQKTGAISEIQTDTRDISKRKKAEDQILEHNRILNWFNQISSAISNSLTSGDILSTIQQNLRDQVSVPAGNVFLYNKETGTLDISQSWRNAETTGLVLPAPTVNIDAPEKTKVAFNLLKNLNLPEHPEGIPWGRLQIPLVAQTQLQGVIDLIIHARPETIRQRIEIVESFGRELGMALYNAQLFQAELKSRNLAETLRDASQALARTLSMDSVLNTLVDLFSKVVPYDAAAIYFFDNETHLTVRVERRSQAIQEKNSWPPIPLDHPFIKALMHEKHSLAVVDTTTPQALEIPFNQTGLHSWACVPINADERVIAICCLGKTEPNFYNEDHLRWLDMLSRQATVAFQNAWLFEQVRTGREKLQNLTRRLVEVQEKERRYVAQELHDDAGQALTSLILNIGALKQEAASPKMIKARAANLCQEAALVLENLRRLAMDLRPATLDHLGLVAALRQYSEIVASQCNVNIQFEAIGLEKRLPDDVEVALYRIVQEALTNVIRHAQANRVDILLEKRAEHIVAVVEDNGIGFEADQEVKPRHLGLVGMQERAEMLGGKLTIESRRGKGTTILIEIPEIKNNGD